MPYRWRIELIASGGSFDVNGFLTTHGVKRERCWHAGEKIGKSTRKYIEYGCSILLTEAENEPDMVLALENQLSAITSWSQAAIEFGADVQLCFVIRTDGADYPSINFSHEMIEALRLAKVSLDIDIIASL